MNEVLLVPYKPGGRSLDGWDCWGCIRYIGAKYKGIPESALPKFGGIDGVAQPDEFQQGYREVLPDYRICDAKDGAIACCYRKHQSGKPLLFHVGICHNNNVIHARAGRGTVEEPARLFKRFFNEVRFFEYVAS